MAGRGPAPKDARKRRNTSLPRRGEWIDLPAEAPGRVPAMPRGSRWSPEARQLWAEWHKDPASLTWTPADHGTARMTLRLFARWEADPTASLAAEIRLRLDGLGLSQKGKRDLRLRVAGAEANEAKPARPSHYAHLTAVPDAG